ncbi:hypothetical protein, partial [Facilibium subflavum]|uniref:hypothetical protein n=1 Tax=Facilibium subflavum TaxID=2219058 RepID=UPI001AADFE0C
GSQNLKSVNNPKYYMPKLANGYFGIIFLGEKCQIFYYRKSSSNVDAIKLTLNNQMSDEDHSYNIVFIDTPLQKTECERMVKRPSFDA